MKKMIASSATLAALLVGGSVWAQQEQALVAPATPENVVEMAAPATADENIDTESYYDWVSEFEQQFQSIGVASDGRAFFSGQAPVRVSNLDPSYGRELALAYEKAMFDMRADFVMQTYGRLVTETVREIYQDDSTNKNEFDPVDLQKADAQGGDRFDALLDKALDLMDKKLDNALVEQGVPAEQVQKLSVEQKKTTYKNNFRRQVVKSAVRSMQGLVPVQTRIFSTDTANGPVTVVGVIAVQSEKTRQFALDMSRKRPTAVRGEPKTLTDLLPAKNTQYLDEIGLRYSYDEQGRPMLISYGRYAVTVSPDWKPARAYQATQNAIAIARTLAESSIVEFMNTNVQVSEKTPTASQEEDLVTKVTTFENGGRASEEYTQSALGETLSTMLKEGRSTASGDLRGSTMIRRWDLKDGNNDKVLQVGAVVSWSYDQLDNANAIDAQSRGQSSNRKSEAEAVQPARASKVINSLDDF